MIVLRSTYDRLLLEHRSLQAEHAHMIDRWNALVRRINDKGGLQFLDGNGAALLSREDIKRLLALCHPDKHDGKRIAQEMTQKLLALREQI